MLTFSSVIALRRCIKNPFQSVVAPKARSESIARLTVLALSLPGLAAADPSEDVGVQYGYYQQSQWGLPNGAKTQYNPLTVNNISSTGIFSLEDRWKFSYNYTQDTWSGATPVASAPVVAGLNRTFSNNGTVSGATPLVNSTAGHYFYYDKELNTYSVVPRSKPLTFVQNNAMTQTVASASPEIRNQGGMKAGYEWDEAAFNVMAGVSREPDFSSNYGGADLRLDFDNKLTSLLAGFSYNSSSISSVTSSYYSYVNTDYYAENGQVRGSGNSLHLVGNRQDFISHLNLSHVVNKDLVVQGSIGFVQNQGYLGNPYKSVEMSFADFSKPVAGTDLYQATAWGVAERRPGVRNQGTFSAGLTQYVEFFDASLHAGYRIFHDDWGITSNSVDLDWVQPFEDGWTLTPRFRYYEQSAAYFYQPYFLFGFAAPVVNGKLNLAAVPTPSAYSSDYRLSAYGALSGGFTLAKKMGKAISAEVGFEYYSHGGNLIPGSSGQGSWSNFNYFQANGAVRIDPSAMASSLFESMEEQDHAKMHGMHLGMNAPAGLLFGHMLEHEGDAMVGIRWGRQTEGGSMMQGTGAVSPAKLLANVCNPTTTCYVPTSMDMDMYMLDIMYAPLDWLTLMVMPQFMAMSMSESVLASGPPGSMNMGNMTHSTGGLSDLFLSGMFDLYRAPGHEVHFTLGVTAPVGSVHQVSFAMGNMGRYGAVQDYGMQLGSGTWDFWPSLTYNGELDRYSWGGQLSVVEPMQQVNASGYRKGTLFQATTWAGYDLLHWLRGGARLLFVDQGAITGAFAPSSLPNGLSDPVYNPQNYGGRSLYVGFGLNPSVHDGAFAGNHFGVEWLQPVYQSYNGYQLSQSGYLYANWGYSF